MRCGEGAQRSYFDDRLYPIFKQHWQNDHIARRCLEQSGTNWSSVWREIGDQHAPFLGGALPCQTFSGAETLGMSVRTAVGKRRQKRHGTGLLRFHLIDNTLLSIHQGREFRYQHAADRAQVTLPLQPSLPPPKILF